VLLTSPQSLGLVPGLVSPSLIPTVVDLVGVGLGIVPGGVARAITPSEIIVTAQPIARVASVTLPLDATTIITIAVVLQGLDLALTQSQLQLQAMPLGLIVVTHNVTFLTDEPEMRLKLGVPARRVAEGEPLGTWHTGTPERRITEDEPRHRWYIGVPKI
jgi:hypothetical protein